MELEDFAKVFLGFLSGALVAGVTSWFTWWRTQRSWRHHERYEAAIGVLREARSYAALTEEWWRLQDRKKHLAERLEKVKKRPRDRAEIAEAQRVFDTAIDKLEIVNVKLLDAAIGVPESSVKLDLLNRGRLATLARSIADAYRQVDRSRTDGGCTVRDGWASVEAAEQTFIAAARRELKSGKSAK